MTIAMTLKDKDISKTDIRENRNVFNTVSPKPQKKGKKGLKIAIIAIVILVILGGATYAIYKGYTLSKAIGFKLDSESILNTKEPELKKDSTGKYTNVLLVGIDTREKTELFNTDSIILISYNYETNDVLMLSVPRDFNVQITEGIKWYDRINSVYASAENREDGSGLDALEKSVETVTGMEIQYHGMVDFKAFTEIVDTVGGIDINVENSFTDYSYPKGKLYETVTFKAGPQTMDGDTALKYARSRHSQQNNEGSDYARARRQQKVIIALKDKILSTETFTNPRKIMEMVASLANNIKVSEFTLEDIEAGLNLAQKFESEEGEVYSFVLDPSIGNYSLVETKILESGAYAIGPKEGFGVYTNIREYVEYMNKYPAMYSEKPIIYVYDTGIGYQLAREKTLQLKKDFPYLNIVFYGTLYKDKEGEVVYTSSEDFPNTVTTLSKHLEIENQTKPEYITTNIGSNSVIILLGKDITTIEESEI